MKKFFWCGCALAVLAAASIYVAADYAGRHPESMFSQCMATACRIGTVNNPLHHASPTAVRLESAESGSEESEVGSEMQSNDSTPAYHLVLPCPEMPVEMCPPPLSITEPATPRDDWYRPMPPCPSEEATPAPLEPSPEAFTERFAVTPEFWKSLQHEVVGPQGDTLHAGKPPTCRENDDCIHEYPGCPQSSQVCPYTGRSVAPEKRPVDAEEQEVLPPPKVRKEPACPCSPCEKEGCPACKPMPNVGTSEFRPGDAKKGEFDRVPF